MLSFAPNIRIFLHARPTDMRNSFDGLYGLVRGVLRADPLDGSLFLFVNRRGDRLRILWWDRDGLALFYKRLESGRFEMLRPEGESAAVELDATELAMLLSAVSLGCCSTILCLEPRPWTTPLLFAPTLRNTILSFRSSSSRIRLTIPP